MHATCIIRRRLSEKGAALSSFPGPPALASGLRHAGLAAGSSACPSRSLPLRTQTHGGSQSTFKLAFLMGITLACAAHQSDIAVTDLPAVGHRAAGGAARLSASRSGVIDGP